MADDWRVRECVNQLLLFFAFEARNAMTAGAHPALAFPNPLRPFHNAGRDPKAPQLTGDIARNPRELDQVLKIGAGPKKVVAIANEPGWRISDVVNWWIRAGVAVAAWRREVQGAAGTDPGAARPVAGRPAPEAVLLDAAIRRLRLEDYGVYPPCWCADHAEPWRLAGASDVETPRAWEDTGTRLEHYLGALLDWCGNPRREEGPSVAGPEDQARVDDWAVRYRGRYYDFAAESARLLRMDCRLGRAAELQDRSADWRVFPSTASPRRIRVLRPPVYAAADGGERVVVGWAMVPWPAVLVEQLRRDVEARGPVPGSVARTLARARAWGAEDTVFGPVLPPQEGGDAAGLRGDVDRLVALASLVTAVELAGQSRPAEPPADPADLPVHDQIRWVLKLEGIEPRWSAASAEGRPRRIPQAAGGAPPVAGATLLALTRPDGDPVVVGEVGAAARCDDGLLATIEALDWRWWALRTLCAAGRRDAALDAAIAAADEVAWESLKGGLLGAEPGAPATHEALAAAHRALHAAWLGLGPRLEDQPRGGIAARTRDEIASLGNAICATLAAADPAGVARLDPPRTPDGRIAVSAWLGGAAGTRSSGWEVAWERALRPFGEPLREALLDDGRTRVTLSAGADIRDDDLRLLDVAAAAPGEAADETILEPLRSRVVAAIGGATAPDLGPAIDEARAACDGERSDAFDRLVARAVRKDARAVACVRLLHDDPRFRFACHPPVEVGAAGVVVPPAAVDDGLAWQDDDAPAGRDVEIRFATDPARARRVVSRGRPGPDSAEACAARLEAALRTGLAALADTAAAVREATDRRRTFGAAAADPVARVLELADALARGSGGVDETTAAFRDVVGWCTACGVTLVPTDWHPARGTPAEVLPVERVDFHPTVPDGAVVVERFGAVAGDGSVVASAAGFVSAGQAPPGFSEVDEAVRGLADDGEVVARFRRSVLEFPRRVRAGQTSTAAAGLFDVAWRAVMAAPDRDDLRRAAAAVHGLLDRSFDMVVFEPKSLGEYHETWLRTSDGRTPRGLRVDRLLRPGLRTLDNRLVWPALVETR